MKKISFLFSIVVFGVVYFYLSVFAQNPDSLIIPTTSFLLSTDRGPNDGDPCDDQNPCTQDDIFSGGVCEGVPSCVPLSCEDAACTPTGGCEITLKSGFCRINNECYPDGTVKIDNPCKVCNAATSPESWIDNSVLCDDGNACTMNDTCTSGVCTGSNYSCDDGLSCTNDSCDGDGTCTNTLQSGSCLIAGTCYANGDFSPFNGCLYCNAPATSWFNRPSQSPCPDDGLSCTDDTCDGTGSCLHSLSLKSGSCLIAGACYANGDSSPINDCLYCNAPAQSWSNRPFQWPCQDDGLSCTDDICDKKGTCNHNALPSWSSCDDLNVSTTGDLCDETTACIGFSKTSYDGGTGDEYVDASVTNQFVHAWWLKTGTKLNVDKFTVNDTIDRTDITAPTYNERFFDVDTYDAVGSNGTYFPLDSTTDDWTSTIEPYTQFTSLPAADFSAVVRFTDPFSNNLYAAGRDQSLNKMIVRKCIKPLLCFPTPCTPPPWTCQDQPVVESIADNHVDCAGAAEVSDNAYFVCNYYITPATDTWPSYITIIGYDSTNSLWEIIGSEYLGGSNNTTKKGTTVKAVGNYLVVGGTGGLLHVFETLSEGVFNNTLITIPNFSDQNKLDIHDSAIWQGRIWLVGKKTVTSLDPPYATTVDLVMAHAATTANLRTSSNWQAQIVDSYSILPCTPPNCPSPEHFTLKGIGGTSNDLYLFGGWWTGNDADPTNRTVWHLKKP